ncbi:MAG: FecR family protein [Bacteroidota bacterium]|nr:FecR family protein [Bacteroidota bacterium]
MKNTYKILLVVLLFLIFMSLSLSNQREKSLLAVVTKVVNSVDKKQLEKDWTEALKGDPLFKGEQLRTGLKSVAIIKFDDKSIMRVLEKSELTMRGEKQKSNIEIHQGTVGFNITKRQNEEYTFSSPTSVASIRGTEGAFFIQVNEDILILSDGEVNLFNRKSNLEEAVGAGEIGFSRIDGTIDVRKATPDELKGLKDTLQRGDIQKQNELKFEFKDPEGNKRELKIQYKE